MNDEQTDLVFALLTLKYQGKSPGVLFALRPVSLMMRVGVGKLRPTKMLELRMLELQIMKFRIL